MNTNDIINIIIVALITGFVTFLVITLFGAKKMKTKLIVFLVSVLTAAVYGGFLYYFPSMGSAEHAGNSNSGTVTSMVDNRMVSFAPESKSNNSSLMDGGYQSRQYGTMSEPMYSHNYQLESEPGF